MACCRTGNGRRRSDDLAIGELGKEDLHVVALVRAAVTFQRECLSNGPEVSTSARTKSPRDQLRKRHHKALAIPLVDADEAVVAGARGQLSRPRRAVMSHCLPVLSCLMCVSQWIGSRQTRPDSRTVADPVLWALVTSSGTWRSIRMHSSSIAAGNWSLVSCRRRGCQSSR